MSKKSRNAKPRPSNYITSYYYQNTDRNFFVMLSLSISYLVYIDVILYLSNNHYTLTTTSL